MNSMKEIAEEAEIVYSAMFSVEDILRGNTIDMHEEARDIAVQRLKELPVLVDRVYDLGKILIRDTITELCDKVAYSHHTLSSYMTHSQLKDALIRAVNKREGH